MSLILSKSAMRRWQWPVLFTIASLTALAASVPAQATSSSGSGGGRAGALVRRCSTCATSRDSVRKNREKLLMKIDSLRYEFDHTRLSEAERSRLSAELNQSILALQAALDEAIRSNAAIAIEAEAAVHAGMAPVAVAVQTGFRTRGYLGVTFDGPSDGPNGPQRIIRFYQYPRIAMVESRSPAQRAGVQEGDTLLALNGSDVLEREISLAKLLVPEARVVLRVRREGNARDLRVVVGEAPEYYISRTVPLMRSPSAIPPEFPVPPRPPRTMGGTVWMFNEGIAGARVETITEGLGRALGAKSGVLVLQAEPGTPAHESGLRDGDVILRASGQEVSNVRELLTRLVQGDGDEGIKLLILRERKQREVVLKW